MSETPAPTMLKTCVQCKGEFETHLFTALNFKSGNDVIEKCFLCRRMVAVNDFIKANAVQSRLSVRAQEDHVLNQENAIFKWERKMLARGYNLPSTYTAQVLAAVKAHPALEQLTEKDAILLKKLESEAMPYAMPYSRSPAGKPNTTASLSVPLKRLDDQRESSDNAMDCSIAPSPTKEDLFALGLALRNVGSLLLETQQGISAERLDWLAKVILNGRFNDAILKDMVATITDAVYIAREGERSTEKHEDQEMKAVLGLLTMGRGKFS